MNPHIFREYDVRGIAERDLTDEVAESLGRALGTEVVESGGTRLALGRDARTSSDRLHAAFVRGVLASGCSVVDVGLVPTPLLYFAANHFEDVGGLAMITGSHNPPEHNGFKVGVGRVTLGGEFIQGLRARIEAGRFTSGEGTVEERDAYAPYFAFLEENLRFGEHRPKVVLDAGNGTGALTALPMLQHAGFDVTGLYLEPDGRFPNHEADPTVEANLADLRRAVTDGGADVGIAYDGDADRIGVVDEQGRIVWGDQLMILFARAILAERPGAPIVAEVKCSKTLYDDIAGHGGRGIMWKAGHSLIKAKMKEEGALLGGEMSGHMFFADRYYGFDDACYATGRLLEILSTTGKRVGELLADVPETFSTPEIRVDCPEELKFDLVAALQDRLGRAHEVVTVDGARAIFPDGWGLVRASNTQPILVLRFEAQSEARLGEIRALVEGELAAARAELEARS